MRVVLTALYSERYPASGESHALSVLVGQLQRDCTPELERIEVLDMVALGRDARSELAALITEVQPELVGISVAYGTYSKLPELVPLLRTLLPSRAQFVYGGALATYLADDILRNIDPRGVVFIGEAEVPFAAYVRAGLDQRTLPSIPGVAYIDEGRIVHNARAVAHVPTLAVPNRRHLAELIPSGIQLYAEASRGCSWSHCTFCLRRLLDIEGVGTEYRRMLTTRLAADLANICLLGGGSVTFADEDLLGGDVAQVAEMVEMLEEATKTAGGNLFFDASATVHSVIAKTGAPAEQAEKDRLIGKLKACGLRKVFLGVESGSATQLRRFAKGHTPAEAGEAIRALRAHGILVELGWIMFDPLCTLMEVRENLEFLLEYDAVDSTSYLFNELRLQRDTSFERLLATYERRTGSALINGNFDPDTLSYPYNYAGQDVATVVALTRRWADGLRPIHYPLKNMTRYGASGVLSTFLEEPRAVLSDLRLGMCNCLMNAIDSLAHTGRLPDPDPLGGLLSQIASRLLSWAERLPPDVSAIELIRVLLNGARAAVSAPDHVLSSRSASMA